MKYIIMFAGSTDDQEQWEKMPKAEAEAAYARVGQWFEEHSKSGKIIGGEELQGPHTATTVRRKNGKVTVTDGPFTESKELISYALYEVRSREEAVEWASRFMKAHRDHWAGWTGSTDILQVMDPAGGPPAE
jgi:hypothetical protein